MSKNGVAWGLREIAKMAGNEESIALDEVIPESRRPPTRDTKYHGQALSEFECETFSPSATESETEFVE